MTYYKSLDGLRALAVAIVMVAHAGSPYPRSGGVGVDIFFVLSGFLITGILAKEFQHYGSVNRKNFYIRRLLRLTPALLACAVLFAIFSWMSSGTVSMHVLAIVLTYTSNYAIALFNYDMQSMAHCWSLAIEEQYYLVWPFIIVFIERRIKSNLRKCLLLLSISLALALYRAAMVGTFDAVRINFALDTRMDGLVMGGALAYFVAALAEADGLKSRTRVFKGISYLLAPASIIGLLILMYFLTWGNPWMGRIGYSLVSSASCVLILDLVASPFSLIRAVLEKPILTFLGKISYGLYLYHFPIYHFVEYQFCGVSRPYVVFVMVAATVAVAALSYFFLEKPILRAKKYFSHGSRPKL